MTKTILAFPVNRMAGALFCLWFIDKAPARSLSCKRIARDDLDAGTRTSSIVCPHFWDKCA
jgi:hypothetical protein